MKGEIEIIKSQRTLFDRSKSKHIDKLRVAAYCRVSTDSEEQLNSYKSQVEYYSTMVSEKADWILVDIYADEAITGTKVDKREGFQRLINDCLNGSIDMVITKSISRFARNTLDTLKYVRMLKEKNIAVMFEEEKINTLTMDGELLLVVLSSVAQQEVENISANVKKGLKMKMQRGETVGYNGCLGYNYHAKDKSMTINEEEAEIVRYIFNRYVEGAGAWVIARELEAMGAKSKRGKTKWHESSIRGIIRNEKYIGDVMMGKTFTVDPISKRRLANLGEEDKVYIRNHHEPIVSKAIFYKAQEILNGRAGSRVVGEAFKRKKYSRQFAFSSMLKCGFCGNSLSRRSWNAGSQYGKTIWHCVAHTQKGSRYCPYCKGIEEKVVEDAFIESYKIICRDNADVLDEFLSRISEIFSESKKKNELVDQLKTEQLLLKQRKSKLLDSLLDGSIDKELFDEKINEIEESIQQVEYQMSIYSKEIKEATEYEDRIEKFRKLLLKNKSIEMFDRAIFESVIKNVIIGGYDQNGNPDPAIITYIYKSGVCDETQLEKSAAREKIVVAKKYEDISCSNSQSDKAFDKLDNLPKSIEVINFDYPYKHMVFNKTGDNSYQKQIKGFCQIRIAIEI